MTLLHYEPEKNNKSSVFYKNLIYIKLFFGIFLYIYIVNTYIAQFYRFRYAFFMFTYDFFIVFPEGDVQEIKGRLPINAVVDINGNQIPLPLPTNRMIAFRVSRIKTNENKGGNETYHYLELLSSEDLIEFT